VRGRRRWGAARRLPPRARARLRPRGPRGAGRDREPPRAAAGRPATGAAGRGPRERGTARAQDDPPHLARRAPHRGARPRSRGTRRGRAPRRPGHRRAAGHDRAGADRPRRRGGPLREPVAPEGELMRLDAITVEILRNYLQGAVEEMAYVVERTAYTTFVKETADFTCGLLNPSGEFFAYPV